VHGPGLFGQPEAAHAAGHGLRAHPLVEPSRDEAAEVGQPPGAGLALVRVGPAQDMVDQHGLLGLAQPLGPASVRTVDQPRQALGVEAHDGVAQRLTLDPRRPRGLGPAHPIQSVGDGQHAPSGPPPGLLLGQPPQLRRRRHIRSDRQPACRHRHLPDTMAARNHAQARAETLLESALSRIAEAGPRMEGMPRLLI
jgi:hypothetical protein